MRGALSASSVDTGLPTASVPGKAWHDDQGEEPELEGGKGHSGAVAHLSQRGLSSLPTLR